MTESKQRRSTKSGSKTDEKSNCKTQQHSERDWLELEPVGTRFTLWETTSKVWRERGHRKVEARCTGCGETRALFLDNLRAGKSHGCNSCSMLQEERLAEYKMGSCESCGAEQKVFENSIGLCYKCRRATESVPRWLYVRVKTIRNRCTNPRGKNWKDYGGRGIEFRFSGVANAARWINDNLEIRRDLQIDRIDNNGHYEPGNLRMTTAENNCRNRRCSNLKEGWVYREEEWPYVESVVRDRLGRGQTREEILAQAQKTVSMPIGKWHRVARRLRSLTS